MDTFTGTLADHPTLSALRGALLVMEAAEQVGLPIPTYVTTSSYAEVTYGNGTSVSWQPGTLDDLYAWAAYLDQPVATSTSADEPGKVYHYCDADLFDQRISLTFIEAVA